MMQVLQLLHINLEVIQVLHLEVIKVTEITQALQLNSQHGCTVYCNFLAM